MSVAAFRLILLLCLGLAVLSIYFGLKVRFYRIEEVFPRLELFYLSSVRATREATLFCSLLSILQVIVLVGAYRQSKTRLFNLYFFPLLLALGFLGYALVINNSPRHISFDEAFPFWIAYSGVMALLSWRIFRTTSMERGVGLEVIDQEVW